MKKLLILISFAVFFVSCTSAPKQQNYPPMLQKHMQAAWHWSLLARSFSKQVADALQGMRGPLVSSASLHGDFGHSYGDDESGNQGESMDVVSRQVLYSGRGPVYIDKRDKSVFGKAFRSMLITELWKHGIEVVDNPEYAYYLGWECQKIYHGNDRRDIFPGIPLLVGATAGYLIFGGDCNFKKPHWEVMIALDLLFENNRLLRRAGINYVNDEDIGRYGNISGPVAGFAPADLTTYAVVGN
jgi:hypothetical protein